MKFNTAAIIATFVFMLKKKTILVAPLNWGLGHATRCVPIIRALLHHNFEVLIATDGPALLLLRKEFSELEYLELPSYNITYPKNGSYFKLKMFLKFPNIQKTINAEKKIVKRLVASRKIQGIISDNRFGVRNANVPSVFITHQLNVLTGSTSFFSSKLHQRIIKKFDVCWVPDVENSFINLSGKLGHLRHKNFPTKYIGVLSRMDKKVIKKFVDILVIISGPEPQRTLFEQKLKETLNETEKKVIIIRGCFEKEQKWQNCQNLKTVNFMTTAELEHYINASELIISRPGYTTLMDLTALEKKAFFIPTPGQYEQKYLAKRLKNLGIAPFCEQKKFTLKKLNEVSDYRGLKNIQQAPLNYADLFSLFQSK